MVPMEEDVLNEWEDKAMRTNNKSVKLKVRQFPEVLVLCRIAL